MVYECLLSVLKVSGQVNVLSGQFDLSNYFKYQEIQEMLKSFLVVFTFEELNLCMNNFILIFSFFFLIVVFPIPSPSMLHLDRCFLSQ